MKFVPSRSGVVGEKEGPPEDNGLFTPFAPFSFSLPEANEQVLSPGTSSFGGALSLVVVAVGDPFSLSASWGYTETAGLSCILVSLIRRRLLQGFLMTTHACHIHTSAPLEAEALMLNWALDYISTAITSDDEKEYVIYIDCKILSTAIQMNNVQDLPYWEAAQTVAQCRKGGLEGTTHAGKLGVKNQRKLQQLSKCQIQG